MQVKKLLKISSADKTKFSIKIWVHQSDN